VLLRRHSETQMTRKRKESAVKLGAKVVESMSGTLVLYTE